MQGLSPLSTKPDWFSDVHWKSEPAASLNLNTFQLSKLEISNKESLNLECVVHTQDFWVFPSFFLVFPSFFWVYRMFLGSPKKRSSNEAPGRAQGLGIRV